jgi:hypothetical protein
MKSSDEMTPEEIREWHNQAVADSRPRYAALEEAFDKAIKPYEFFLTDRQRRTIWSIWRAAWNHAAGQFLQYVDNYEVEDFEVEEDFKVIVRIHLKRSGGTYASDVFFPIRQQFYIGKLGGVSWHRWNKKTKKLIKEEGIRNLFHAFHQKGN